MEDLAKLLLEHFPEAQAVSIKLMWGPHHVTAYRGA